MSSSPKFFRMVLQRNLDDPKLMIPKTFVEDYGKALSNWVNLKLSDGLEWKVGLRKATNGALWLEKGWDKFSEHYCLEFGSLLIFTLLNGRRSSNFEVTIFDPTGVETKYVSSSPQLKEDSDTNADSGYSYSDSDESSESFREHSKKRKNALVPCWLNRKKMRKDGSSTIKIEPADAEEEECNNVSRETPSCKKRVVPKHEVKASRKKQQSPRKVETTQRFSSKSDHKPSFKVVMRRNNVQGRFNMVIPHDFAVKYLSEESGTINLQITNGRNWQLLYKWCRTDRATFAYISSGWKHFVEKNRLKEGDIGLFQLINKHNMLFTELQNNSLSPKKKTATTGNPFFEVDIVSKSYMNSYLNIPRRFAGAYFSPKMQSASLQVGNKKWDVSIKKYACSHVRFAAGWGTFHSENGLEDGDTCLFEMVNTKLCVLKVSIFRKVSTSVSMD
ncbi:B3 domain-containing transcription factor VRN1 isoform X2 [Cucumis sativus]|uniref:B3 domain-containing transcription factor VRN1 isoform X2 n=1 Tax=Cucumis sativus TaxID=3659 RepID=UPI0005EC25D6|nr:B3 domain-containing transcription factor VRN1 isoform X2 [Cucumis sativus]